MADYIDRNILSQAYIHVENVNLSDDALESLKKTLERYIESRGKFFLYEDVETDVEFRDGSLKVYVTVAGFLLTAIQGYKGFREGVNFLAMDAKRLADCVVSESLFLTKSRHGDTIRAEARLGVVGSLKGVIDRLDLIQSDMSDVSMEQTARHIADVQESVKKLMSNINSDDDSFFIADNLCKLVKHFLPLHPPAPKKKAPTEAQVAIYRGLRKELIDFLESIAPGKKAT